MRAARLMAAFAAGSLALSALPAQADDATEFEYKAVTGSRDITLDPAKAYLLVEAPGMMMSSWLVMPDDAQRADWERQRQAELAEAIEKYPSKLERYEREYRTWAATRRKRGSEPVRPVEPTDETFPWPDLESRRIMTIGPQNRLASEKEYSLWLYEVPATEFIFRGLGMGSFGDCTCMGTLAFDTKVGKVTAVRIGHTWLDADGQPIDRFPKGSNSIDISTRATSYIEPPSDYALDPRIPRDMIAVADFRLVESMPNWHGQTINRVRPYPGLFTYEGTRMVDLRPGAAAKAAEVSAAPDSPE